jgi:hypothetical protein
VADYLDFEPDFNRASALFLERVAGSAARAGAS